MDLQQRPGLASASPSRLGAHDHACMFHGSEPERLDIASAFLRLGLARGERCVYAADENRAGRIMPHLRAAGIDVGQGLASGSLEIATDAGILPFGPLEGESFAALEARIDAALASGYKGLRLVAEPTWAVARSPKLEALDGLEERLRQLFRERPLIALWQYDRAKSSPGLLRRLLRMHPFVLVGDEVHRNGLFVAGGAEPTGGSGDPLERAIDSIVERARADDVLAVQLDELQRALEGGAHALWDWDAEGDRITVDPRWAEMPGIDPSRSSISLSEWEQVVHPDELASMWKAARDHIDGRSERLDHECRMRGRSGNWRWVQLRAKAVRRDAAGQGTRIAGTVTDVTSVREARDRVVAGDELAAAARFTSRIAHEINNPLAGITTNVGFVRELLQRSADSGSPAPTGDVSRALEALRETEEGAGRIRDVVGALPRAFDSFEKGRAAPLDPRAEILASVSQAREAIARRSRLSVSVPERLPRVAAHAGALGKVFLNLLRNAAYAIPEGSPEENEVRLAAYLRGERLVVEVTDSGVGMSPVARDHMFDLFLASEANTSPEFTAGLFLCRAIVQRAGGQMEVESEPARGTTVRVLLPVWGEDIVR
jgi:PAS domain S-box-containing protein